MLSPQPWPETMRTHHAACVDCQAWLAHEHTWQQVFARVPSPRARPSVWPGVMAAIAARQAQPASFDLELVSLSRYVVPALTVLVLALGGVGLWGQVLKTQNTPAAASVWGGAFNTELAFLGHDAETIMEQWVGVSQQ
jgi:hypothetical protein